MGKLKVGILGATGMVGQNYIRLLENHPWFEVADVAASPRSAGKTYEQATNHKWQMPMEIPNNLKDLIVRDVQDFNNIDSEISFMFSAMDLPKKEDTREIEFKYAKEGLPIVSNSSANRWTLDVPMIIPEVNHEHVKVIPIQQTNRGFSNGFVVVKPNCSIQSYVTPIYALEQSGYKVDKLIVTTLQAVSGAGYPGVASLDVVDNIIPFINGEEEKSEKEPAKIMGTLGKNGILNDESIQISATCTRVPVSDGHTACVSIQFKNKIPSQEDIIRIWTEFKSLPQELELPFAPKQPIIYLENSNRPQPKKDRENDKGMAVTIGRLREDNVFHFKFIGLSHNTIRGAAGGAILNAELLKVKGYLE